MSEDSYIKMPAAKVIELAQSMMRSIDEFRERQWVIFTEGYNRKWWRRLLRLRPLTVDEVKVETEFDINWGTPRWACCSQYWRCEELIHLACGVHKGTGEILLSHTDYKTLTK